MATRTQPTDRRRRRPVVSSLIAVVIGSSLGTMTPGAPDTGVRPPAAAVPPATSARPPSLPPATSARPPSLPPATSARPPSLPPGPSTSGAFTITTSVVPRTDTASTPTRRPPASTTDPAIGTHRSGVYCGPSAQDVRQRAAAIVTILDGTGISELRPPCNSRYGRRSTGELVFAGRLAVDDAIVRDNRTLLAFSVDHGYQYYVDDARFLSGDTGLVSAAFDDYADYLYSGAFAVEITDEPTVDVLERNLTTVAQLGQELARRNSTAGRVLPLTAILRPSVNFVPGSDKVIPALRLALGPNARFSVDAYTIDPSIWARFLSLFDITDRHPAPSTDYDIQLTVPMTRWVDAASGAARSPDVTAESLKAYLTIAAGYAGAGVHGVMLFTGFAADDNIYDDHFEGALVDTKVRKLVQGALARYRQLVPG